MSSLSVSLGGVRPLIQFFRVISPIACVVAAVALAAIGFLVQKVRALTGRIHQVENQAEREINIFRRERRGVFNQIGQLALERADLREQINQAERNRQREEVLAAGRFQEMRAGFDQAMRADRELLERDAADRIAEANRQRNEFAQLADNAVQAQARLEQEQRDAIAQVLGADAAAPVFNEEQIAGLIRNMELLRNNLAALPTSQQIQDVFNQPEGAGRDRAIQDLALRQLSARDAISDLLRNQEALPLELHRNLAQIGLFNAAIGGVRAQIERAEQRVRQAEDLQRREAERARQLLVEERQRRQQVQGQLDQVTRERDETREALVAAERDVAAAREALQDRYDAGAAVRAGDRRAQSQ